MGLLDILNGMRNGPGGAPQPQAQSGGGMPTWMMALLGLLAYKAIKGRGGAGDGRAAAPGSSGGGLSDILGGMLGNARPGAAAGRGPSGGLGDLLGGGRGAQGGLGGILGGLLAGGAAGSLLNGGLRNLVSDMERNGQGDAVQSWIGRGENQSLAPSELARAAGIDDIDAVARETGMPRDQLISDLSEHLPAFVDQLTPDGRLPTDDEASQWV
jgi:uncharacterized protein YidB (DUF937 family)